MALGSDQNLNIIVRLRDEASRKLGEIGKTAEEMEPTFKRMSVAGGVALAALSFGMKKAVDEAVKLGESVNAVNVVFQDGADEILKFGESASKAVGLSNSQFNQMATITGALLKDTGIGMEAVAEETINLTRRAADMASVFNTDVNGAMSAINQAIRGETEAIRAYAGDVTDATLQTFLLSKGINKQVRDLTEQEKRLYRVQLIMAQTAVTAGDFANTSDSLANRQRVLSAQFSDLSAKLGGQLIPMVEKLLDLVQPLLESIGSWVQENPKLAATIVVAATALAGLVTAVGLVGLVIPTVTAAISFLATAMFGAGVASTTLTPAMSALAVAINASLLQITLITAGIAALIGVMIYLGTHLEELKAGWILAFTAMGIGLEKLKNGMSDMWSGIKTNALDAINFLVGLAEGLANTYVKAVNAIIDALNSIQVSIPDWVPGVGGESFGINLDRMAEVSLPRFEHGGTVRGARGTAVPIMAHGGERIIPASNAGGSGGVTVNLTLNYPSFKSREDMQLVREQLDVALRDIARNYKIQPA